MNYDLSIIIPGRNEMFFAQTVKDAICNIEGNTEIIYEEYGVKLTLNNIDSTDFEEGIFGYWEV